MKKLEAEPRENALLLKRSRASIGDAVRISQYINVTNSNNAAPKAEMTIGELQPMRYALVMTSKNTATDVAERNAPSQSNFSDFGASTV